MIEYKSYDYTRTIPVDDYILRYRDERRFMAYCRECRRYGNSWSCPPFNDSEDYLSGFRNLLIVCTRITPVVLDVPDAVEAGQELMHRERSRLDKRLLALEEEYNGRAFYAGVVSFALGKSVHVDLVRLAATPRGFVVPLKPVGSIWDVLPRSCSV